MTEKIRANGDLYEGVYEGWYCESCEAFKPEKDLVDGLCPIHRTKPAWISETNHFFRLSAYRDRLLAHFAAHPEFLQPDVRRNEILRLLEAGLEDISISRAGQPWGIPRALRSDRASSTSGSTRSSTTSPRSATAPIRIALAQVVAGRACTSSARTSRASTPSSGRRC